MDDRFDETRCYRCLYSLAGLSSLTCPECGTDITAPAVQKAKRRAALRDSAIDKGSLPIAFVCATLGWWALASLAQVGPYLKIKPWILVVPGLPFLLTLFFSSLFFSRLGRRRGVLWPAIPGTVIGLFASIPIILLGQMAMTFVANMLP
jgi:hypothetical protein